MARKQVFENTAPIRRALVRISAGLLILAAGGCAAIPNSPPSAASQATVVTRQYRGEQALAQVKPPATVSAHPVMPVTSWAETVQIDGKSEEADSSQAWYEQGLMEATLTDHQNYYTRSDLRFAAIALGIAATFAHSDVDEQFRSWWQTDVRSNAWDDFSHFSKPLGDGYISIAIVGTGALVGRLADQTQWGRVTGEWGRRSIRAFAVGAPPLLLVQAATGASRPGETTAESDWVPFHDTNGASGHAFMGAIPFLVAADMTESRFWSGLWYTGSIMCAVSRVNDDDHYLSQVILGWCLAEIAAEAVNLTQTEAGAMELVPMVGGNGTVGVGVQFRR